MHAQTTTFITIYYKYLIMFCQKFGNMNCLGLLFGLLIFALFLSTSTLATDYYVATWGNNSNPGTLDAPWQNVSYAVQKAVAGDTIYLINGTWYKEYVVFAHSGNATHPITLTAYNGTPTLDGVDKTGTGININFRNYINIIGLKIMNYERGIDQPGSYINISNCDLRHFGGRIIAIAYVYNDEIGSSYNILNNCTLEDSGWNTIQFVGREYGSWPPTSMSHHIYITNNRIINHTRYHSGGIDIMGQVEDIFIS